MMVMPSECCGLQQVPFLAELLKLLVSFYLLRKQQKETPELARMTQTWQSIMLFPVPSLIYWVHNNVQASVVSGTYA